MINGLILVPKNEEYLKEKSTVQMAVDTITMLPAVERIVVLCEQADTNQVRIVKCNNNDIKTRYLFTCDEDTIIKIIAQGRLKGKITALIYEPSNPLMKKVLTFLEASLNLYSRGIYGKLLLDDVLEAVDNIGSHDFRIKRSYTDQYHLTVNNSSYRLVDLGGRAYMCPMKDTSLGKITKIRNIAQLLVAVTKKKNRVNVGEYEEKITLNDGTEIVFARSGGFITKITKPSNEEVVTSHEHKHPNPLWIPDNSLQENTRSYVKVPSKTLETVTRNENEALLGIGSVEPVRVFGDTSNLNVPNNDDVRDMLQNATVEVNNEVVSEENNEHPLVMEHQTGETNVKAYTDIRDSEENTEPKVYPNITEEDAMPVVYTGNPRVDRNFLGVLNHYKLNGTNLEKEIVSIIESKSFNAWDLNEVLSKGAYDKFMSLQRLSKTMSKNSITRLKEHVKA